MLNSLDGPILLHDAFGALLAFKLATMLQSIERPIVCGNKIEHGVPFFDDLDAADKTVALHALVTTMFTRESPILNENAYHSAALTALENHVKVGVEREITMRYWSKEKYGHENRLLRTLIILAFQSRHPMIPCPTVESVETSTFIKLIDRLFANIRPKSYFFMADVPEPKRTELMKRSFVPDNYFDPLEETKNMSEEDRQELQRSLLADAMNRCESMLSDWRQADLATLTADEEFNIKKQIEIVQDEPC